LRGRPSFPCELLSWNIGLLIFWTHSPNDPRNQPILIAAFTRLRSEYMSEHDIGDSDGK